ncbi:MAG TPA: Na+/H+ antiporter subunit E [Egibacteraceae bacterium]|nr:Na+/H+ antiporter subunit E [Egibacteraceae bacterium]
MSGRLLLAGWLVIVWIALWGSVTPANALGGALVAATVLAMFPGSAPRAVTTPVRPVAAASFLLYFAWKLVESNAIVAWEIVTPGSRIVEGVIAVPLERVSDATASLIANAITLTPGTLTIEAVRTGEDVTLYVHVLHLRDIDAVRADLRGLGVRAIRAFGSAEARPARAGGTR